jgi:hypothetical protein
MKCNNKWILEGIMQDNIEQWVTLVNIVHEVNLSLYVRRFSNSHSAIRLKIQIV